MRNLKKIIFISFLFLFITRVSSLQAQELYCNVSVSAQKIQGSYLEKFRTMQTAIYEFVNNRAWTNNVFDPNERIECSILINLTEQVSSDVFKGTMQIQSRRPVYNTSYNTTMFTFVDNDIQFSYIDYQPLEFNEMLHLSNLTSLLAYYVYIIIGMDYDSFSLEGGTPYFEKAERIVNNAQNVPEPGWKPFSGSGNKNRYWLIQNILDDKYSPVREFIYRYHRLGLDIMESKLTEGRAEIADDLRLLQKVYREKPDPYLFFLRVVLDAKRDEMIKIFSESFPDEQSRVIQILSEIDPANSSKYEKIKKQ
ncbi:MAG: DUF4835 family protein [Chlorobi bacterium]|nr:DUF4835 family protein [Chlorobiota bacterium]